MPDTDPTAQTLKHAATHGVTYTADQWARVTGAQQVVNAALDDQEFADALTELNDLASIVLGALELLQGEDRERIIDNLILHETRWQVDEEVRA